MINKARHSYNWFIIPFLGPPVIYSIHLLVCYLMASATTVVGTTWQRVEIIIITVIALLLIALCGLAGWGYILPKDADAEAHELPQFMAWFGVANALLFGIGIFFTLAPAMALRGFSI